jgi:hypothetical protein
MLPTTTSTSTSTSTTLTSADCSIISQGGICVRHDWISRDEITALQQDITYLRAQKAFQPSGLSNRVDGDTNMFGSSDRLTCTLTPDIQGNVLVRSLIEQKLEVLKAEIQDTLNRKQLYLAEQYYSVSPINSFLPRHMDERHEETKGLLGYLNDTRRSISWLLYLNDCGWGSASGRVGAGGELRAYCRHSKNHSGAHEGDLQVGWLPVEDGSQEFEPVFLDSWVKTPLLNEYHDDRQWRPLSALYCLQNDGTSPCRCSSVAGNRRYLTDPFGADNPSWPSDTDLDPLEFAAALASQLPSPLYDKFVGVEDLNGVQPVDVLPTGGTLAFFDSATVPHEVLRTTKGERLAMAGWFHEPTQDFPEWYGT